jgi:hypothetical protein
MPVILATQEGEIGRIEVWSQPRQIVVQELISKKNPSQKKSGGVAQGVGLEFKPQYWKKKQKTPTDSKPSVQGWITGLAWFRPVIPAIWEAEIRRITFGSQRLPKTLSQK